MPRELALRAPACPLRERRGWGGARPDTDRRDGHGRAARRACPRQRARPRQPARPRRRHDPGVRVGHATDAIGLTGCTVILPAAPAVGGLEIRGRAAGVHGIEFLDRTTSRRTWTRWSSPGAARSASSRSGA